MTYYWCPSRDVQPDSLSFSSPTNSHDCNYPPHTPTNSSVPQLIYGGLSPAEEVLASPLPHFASGSPLRLHQFPSPRVVEGQHEVNSFNGWPPSLTSPSPLLLPPSSIGEDCLSSPLFPPEKDDLPGVPCRLEALDNEPTREAGALTTLLFTTEPSPPPPDTPTLPAAPSRPLKKRKPIGRLYPQPGSDPSLSLIIARGPFQRQKQKKKKKKPITGSVQPPSPTLLWPDAATAGPSHATEPAFLVHSLETSPQDVPVQMGSEGGFPGLPTPHYDGSGSVQGDLSFHNPFLGLPPWELDWLFLQWASHDMHQYLISNGDTGLDSNPSQPLITLPSHQPSSQDSTDHGYPPPPPASPGGLFPVHPQFEPPPPGHFDGPISAAPPPPTFSLTPLGAIDAIDASPEMVKQALVVRIEELVRYPDLSNSEAEKLVLKRCLTTHTRMIANFAPLLPHALSHTADGGKDRQKMGCIWRECRQTLSSPQRLFTHLETHLKTKGVVCRECKLMLAGDMDRHFRLVHHKCLRCGAPVDKDSKITHLPDSRCTKRKRKAK